MADDLKYKGDGEIMSGIARGVLYTLPFDIAAAFLPSGGLQNAAITASGIGYSDGMIKAKEAVRQHDELVLENKTLKSQLSSSASYITDTQHEGKINSLELEQTQNR